MPENPKWQQVRLREILTYVEESVPLDDFREYLTITVKRKHGGLEARERLLGHEIKTKKQFRLIPGAFIISRIQCWHQAYAVVPEDVPDNMIASQNYDQFTVAPAVDSRFFWWFSHSPLFTETVRSSAFGVVIEKMVFNCEAWLEKEIPLPPLDEQRRIVSRIEALVGNVEKVQILRSESALGLRALTQSRLSTMFQNLAARYGLERVGELITEANYGTSKKCVEARLNGAVPVLRIPNVASELTNCVNLKYAVLSDSELRQVQLRQGDILVVRTNGSADLVGRCAVVTALIEPTAFASYLIRLRVAPERVLADYLQLMLKHLRTNGNLIDFARTTAGQYNVSLGRLRTAQIPVPPLHEQQEIVNQMRALEAEILPLRSLQAETAAELDALMPSILSKAFRGEL